MKATIFDLGGGIGVCHFRRENLTYVAEVAMDEHRVLPQSVREVRAILHREVEIDDEASAQDHIERAILGLKRFHDRLVTFDLARVEDADVKGGAQRLVHELWSVEAEVKLLRVQVEDRAGL